MKFTNLLTSWGAYLLLDKPVINTSLTKLVEVLEKTGQELHEHLASCSTSTASRNQLCHIIGIERWGQRRLRVAFGEPYLPEDYDHYKPSIDQPWELLIEEWDNTRRTTIELVNEIAKNNIPDELTIPHNQFGKLHIKGWLRYLDLHASGEGKRIK